MSLIIKKISLILFYLCTFNTFSLIYSHNYNLSSRACNDKKKIERRNTLKKKKKIYYLSKMNGYINRCFRLCVYQIPIKKINRVGGKVSNKLY